MNHIPLLEGESPDPLADRTGGGKRPPYMPLGTIVPRTKVGARL